MRVQSLFAASALAIGVMLAPPAGAQGVGPSAGPVTAVYQGPVRGQFNVGLSVAQPLGAFRQYVKVGGGVEGGFLWNLSRDGAWGIRADAGYLIYGSENKRTRLSNSIGDRIQVDVSTTNNIGTFGIGPSLQVPRGAVRPYLNGLVGFSYFFTESSVEGTNNDIDFARTTNFDDATLTYGGGGGLLFPLSVKTAVVSIDLGARFLHNGETKYLREGSIQDNPDGSITFTPIRSEVELIVYRLGVNVGFR